MALADPRSGQDDRCPYSRSFSAAFAEEPQCPAYQSATFAVTDMSHRSLGAALTCRHLTVGDSASSGRFYPRCGLGAVEQRERWAASITPARLEVMRSLDEEFDLLMRAERTLLLEAKARVLLAPDHDGAALDELEAMLGSFLDIADAFIEERAARLRDVGLPADALHRLLHDWSLAWLRSREMFGPRFADVPMTGISATSAALLGVQLPRELGGPPAAVVFTAGALTVERLTDPPRVRLRGEIDVSNAEALVTGIMAAAGATGDIIVDFGDVRFCDLGGLRALVVGADTLGPGRRFVLHNLPDQLRRAVRIVGWAELPKLVVLGLEDEPGMDEAAPP